MKSVVLLSGGVDSTVSLHMARQRGDVEALTVDYGQTHFREVDAAADVADFYNVPHCVVTVDSALFGGSALTGTGAIPENHAEQPDATYVPARNSVLLALGAARAESIGANTVVIGANADDEAGYPDCRRKFIEAFRDVLQLGTINHVWVSAPLLAMTKKRIIDYATAHQVPVNLCWSCYRGGDSPCGHCGACKSLGGAV